MEHPNENGHWWVWREICDRCGKLIQDESAQSTNLDDSKVDFCTDCIRYLRKITFRTKKLRRNMEIGKFRIDLQYDMKCDICGNYRSVIGCSSLFMSVKPTVKTLRSEGWNIVPFTRPDGSETELQLCPYCNSKTLEN